MRLSNKQTRIVLAVMGAAAVWISLFCLTVALDRDYPTGSEIAKAPMPGRKDPTTVLFMYADTNFHQHPNDHRARTEFEKAGLTKDPYQPE